MADLPIQPPPATPPPFPPTPPSDGDSLEALSPFNVLQKKGSSSMPLPGGAPAPVAPALSAPQPSREELLKQAAEAPKESFILPSENYKPEVAQGMVTGKVIGNVPVPQPLAPIPPRPPEKVVVAAPGEMAAAPKPMERPAFVPIPPQAPPPPPKPATPPHAPKPMTPPVVMPKAVVPPQIPMEKPVQKSAGGFGVKQSSKVGLFSVIGLLVVLVVFGASAYIMALNGTRVPVLYTMITGQKTSGSAVMADVAAILKSEQSYSFSDSVKITPKSAGDQVSLPSTDGGTAAVQSIASSATASQYQDKGATYVGQRTVFVNGGSSLDVALQSGADAWYAYFPEASTPAVVVAPGAELAHTLLFPALKPISLETYIAAVNGISKPEKRLSKNGNVKVSAFTTAFDAAKLAAVLPDGAKVTSTKGVIEVAWKGSGVANRPVSASMDLGFTYKGTDYIYSQIWNVTQWSAAVDTAKNAGVKPIVERDKAAETTAMTTTAFIGQLGIGSLSLLPNTIDGTTPDVAATTGPVTPSGETIGAVTSDITVLPAAPDQPAGDEAKKRDTQRKLDMGVLQTALEAYKKDNQTYPVSDGLKQTLNSSALFDALVPKYLTAMPVDPLKSTYWYEYVSDGTTFTVRSVLEDTSDTLAKKGSVYSYYELTNK